MVQAIEHIDRREQLRSVVLLARIVDREGRNIRREDVAAVEYSVYGVDHAQPDERSAVTGHIGVPLAVAGVLFDALQLGGGWSVDASGYNFRHAFELSLLCSGTRSGRKRFKVRYNLVSRFGDATTICFEIRT